MPSVEAIWWGQCHDRGTRDRLLGYIDELAALSHSYYGEPPAVKHVDTTLTGTILAKRVLFSEEARQKGDADGRIVLRDDGQVAVIGPVRVAGTVFHLFDPRGLYDDRVSFAFWVDEDLLFDGRLLCIKEPSDYAGMYPSPPSAEWYLTPPSLDLRYYLEEWTDQLIGWVKRFFIPNVRYWRWDDRWDDSQHLEEAFVGTDERGAFEQLLAGFRASVVDWAPL